MGMVKKEVTDTKAETNHAPVPALPSFGKTEPGPLMGSQGAADVGMKPHMLPSKEVGMTRGGVAHDAAAITAAMSAMKTDEEVKVLFTSLYRHILALVME